MVRVNWSELSSDLLDEIIRRLLFPDLIRFSCVCSSWKSSSTRQIYHYYHHPWLIVPYNNFNSHASNICLDSVLGFFSLKDGVKFNIKAPELYGRRICGSSHGWLITVHANAEMQLINPFTKKILNLPPFTEFPYVCGHDGNLDENGRLYYLSFPTAYFHERAEEMRDSQIHKAIAIPAVGQGPHRVVAISLGRSDLYFCVPGDGKSWNKIECNIHTDTFPECHTDLAIFDNQLYALTHSGSMDVVNGLDGSCTPNASLFVSAPGNVQYRGSNRSNYLVACPSKLLQVIRWYSRERFCAENTKSFTVYQLDFSSRKWVEIETLEDRALFLGLNYSISVVASDFPGCKRNSIYFSDTGTRGSKNFTGHDKGVFNLDDGTISQVCPIDSEYLSPCPLWYSAYL